MVEIYFRIQIVSFSGFYNGEDDRVRFCSALRIAEKPVLSANHDRADSVLNLIIADVIFRTIDKSWRESNPNIVKLWWDVDNAAMTAVSEKTTASTHGIRFVCKSGMLFVTLPSGRQFAYVKPMIGTNKFGSPAITYLGVGGTKRWERLETYGPKLVENIVQGFSRDVLCHAMNTLRHCFICGHVPDEVIIEANPKVSLEAICEQMSRTPPWAEGLILRADGYTTPHYKKS